MMNKMRPRNPRSSSQQLTRMNASYLSGKWNSLPNTSKDLWNQFASLSKPSWSGINAFVALNLNLITSNYGGFSIVTNPPPTPSTPRFVESLYVSKTSGSYNTIYWNHPQTSSDYISIYYSIQSCYSQKGKESWKLLQTIPSSTGFLNHVHGLPSGFIISYRARCLDIFGRVSPFTHASSGPFTESAYLSGRYGITKYGFSYYGLDPSVFVSDVSIGSHSTNVKNAFIYGFGESIDSDDFSFDDEGFGADILSCRNLGLIIFVRSTNQMQSYIETAESYYPDIQCFMPSGSNDHYQIFDSGGDLPVIVTAGAGDEENETAWDCEFFDSDPYTPEPYDWSSYSNAHIAGKLLKIKLSLDCSWWEARHRARMTASRSGIWDPVDGYGIIDVAAAIAYSGEIPSDPYI